MGVPTSRQEAAQALTLNPYSMGSAGDRHTPGTETAGLFAKWNSAVRAAVHRTFGFSKLRQKLIETEEPFQSEPW
jgi:hypothetical protein